MGLAAVCIHIEHALALQLQVALTVETGLGAAGSAVLQGVLCILLHAQVYALAVGDVYRSAVRIGQCKAIQRHSTLGTAAKSQRTVSRSALEVVGYLLHRAVIDEVIRDGIALCYRHMCTAHADIYILSYVARHIDQSTGADICDIHLIITYCGVIGKHRRNITHSESLTHYVHR